MEKFTYLDYLKYTKQMNQYSYLSDVNEEYQLNRIHQPQDKGYKIVLNKKEEAIKVINTALELEKTKDELKQEEIEIYNANFITEELKEERADVVYKKKDQNIFFLIEHQSKVDYSMAYRICKYSIEIIKQAVNEKSVKNKNITDYLQKIVKQKLAKQEVHLLMEMMYNSKDIEFCEVKKIVEELKKTKGEDVTMLTPLQEYVEELNKKERKAGRTEGRKQEKNKIVKKMLQNNIKESIIKKVVNITQKELEEIKAIVAK